MQYFTYKAILICTILTLFIHHVQGISPTEEVYDENYFLEHLPKFENPVDVKNELDEMEAKAGWKLENMYDENSIIHRYVMTPYDIVPAVLSIKHRRMLTNVHNEPIKRALLKETITSEKNGLPLESIEEMKELLELKILSETSKVDIKSSAEKIDKTNKIVNGRGFVDLKGSLLSKLWLQLGNVHRSVGNLDKAILCLRKSYYLDPENDHATSALGAMLRSRGRPNDALMIFRIAYTRKPNSYVFNHHLGEVLRKLKRFSQAINYYDTALKINPHFLQTRKRIAELRKMGYFPESEISSNYIAVFLSDCLYVLRMFYNFMSMCVKYCYSSYIFSCIMISIAVLMCTELFFSKYLFGNNHSRRNAMRTVVNNKNDDNSGGSDKRNNNNNNNSKRKKRKHL